ncbi:MAG: hypothetical protein GY861_03455, partial [bacterium]|nr:hypothetical protein [bacterium]
GFISDVAEKLGVDTEVLADLISGAAKELNLDVNDLKELITGVSENLNINSEELVGIIGVDMVDEVQIEEDIEKPAETEVVGEIVEQSVVAFEPAVQDQEEEKQEKPAATGMVGELVKQAMVAVETVVENQEEEKPESVNKKIAFEKSSSEQPSDAKIQQNVAEWLTEFVGADDKRRQEMLAELGLTDNQITEVMANFAVESIAVLIDLINQTGDLANCATEALGNLFDTIGITTSAQDKEEIATTAILVDVLMGAVTAESLQKGLSEGTPFETSLLAIQKAASVNYGIELSASVTNYDDLESYINDGNSVIVHVGDNHYIVVAGMENEVITYVDIDGNEYTISEEDFIKWTGNDIKVLSEFTIGVEMADQQAITTKGSSIRSFIKDCGNAVSSMFSGATELISDTLGNIVEAVGSVFNDAVGVVSGAWNSVFNKIRKAIGNGGNIIREIISGAWNFIVESFKGVEKSTIKTDVENQVENKQEKPAVAGVAGKIVEQTA